MTVSVVVSGVAGTVSIYTQDNQVYNQLSIIFALFREIIIFKGMDFTSTEVITAAVGLASTAVGSLSAYFVAKKQERAVKREESISEIKAIQNFNESFRNEMRADSVEARRRIQSLEDDIKLKNKEVEELRNSIADMKNELANKDKRISDMKVEIMKRDLQIAELKSKIDALSEQTDAVVERQNLQQKQMCSESSGD